jgi:hypothetical protein
MGAVMEFGIGTFAPTEYIYVRIGKEFWDFLKIGSKLAHMNGSPIFFTKTARNLKVSCKNALVASANL